MALRRKEGARVIQLPSGCMPMISECACWAIWRTIVAHGYLVVSLAAGLFVDPEPGPVLANYGIDNLRFLTPLKPGDAMTVTLTCKQISPRAGDYGEVRWDAEVTNQDGTVVATYDVLTMVAKEWNT